MIASTRALSCGRRPSQKVKVLKRVIITPILKPRLPSQTFPEGKGVETVSYGLLPGNCPGRRPSQKVKVLKLDLAGYRPFRAGQSQTFPEGKGVETSRTITTTPSRLGSRRPSQKVKVLKPPRVSAVAGDKSRRRPSQKVKVLKQLL